MGQEHLAVGLLVLAAVLASTRAADLDRYLTEGQSLAPGDRLVSSTCHLIYQHDGDLVLYHGRVVKWRTGALPAAGFSVTHPQRVTLQADGSLAAFFPWDHGSEAYWSSNTQEFPGQLRGPFELHLLSSCNLVITDGRGLPVWATATYLGKVGPKPEAGTASQLSVDAGSGVLRARLRVGASLLSANKRVWVTCQADGKLVVFSSRGALWASTAPATPMLAVSCQLTARAPHYTRQHVGALTVSGHPLRRWTDSSIALQELWSSAGQVRAAAAADGAGDAGGTGGDVMDLVMQDDCNLVQYEQRGPGGKSASAVVLWNSSTGCRGPTLAW